MDQQLRKAAAPAVFGRGAATAASSSDQCHRCKEFGHFQRDCLTYAQPSRPTKGKKPGKKRGSGGSGQSKWCAFYRTKTHSDAECKAQQDNRYTRKQEEIRGLAGNLALLRAAGLTNFFHSAQPFQAASPKASQAPSEPATFEFSFNAFGASAAAAASPAASAPVSSVFSARDHHLPFEYFGAFISSPAAELSVAPFRLDGSPIPKVVDTGVTDNYLSPALTICVRAHMRDIEDVRIPLPIVATGQHVLHKVTTGVIFGTVDDDSGNDRQVSFRVVYVPELGTNLFSVTAALSNGVASIFYPDNNRLESGDVVVPMKIRGVDEFNNITCCITVKFSAGDSGRQTFLEAPDGLALRVETACFWHGRMWNTNSLCLDVLRKEAANGIDYTGDVHDCSACPLGKSSQKPHLKYALYIVSRAFQIVFVDTLGPFTHTALGGIKYATKFVDQHTKWKGVVLIKDNTCSTDALELFNKGTVILRSERTHVLRADKGTDFTSAAYRQYYLDIGI